VRTIGLEVAGEVVRMRQSRREPMRMRAPTALALLVLLGGIGTARAGETGDLDLQSIPCCQYDPYDAIVWFGTDSLMTLQKLAAYCAPLLWFSPDEPLLEDTHGADIRIPASFPFETASLRFVIELGGGSF
jgi:hypothetical protein